jgi:D-alanyl-D-alanine carboxypeptidase
MFVGSFKTVPAYSSEENNKMIEKLKHLTDSLMQNSKLSGICAIVIDRNKGISWSYATGYASIPDKKPISLDNTFRIGSVTKTMVATVILQLADEGKLSLSDKLSKYFPQYPNSELVTITKLLSMTSGIYEYSYDPQFNQALISNPTKVWTPQELVDLAFLHDFDFTQKCQYVNTNYIILGLIIEKITGSTLKAEIEKRIVQKLHLANTGFLTSGITFPGNNAKGYYFGPYIENDEYTNRYDISWAWAAGSAYSTPNELVKYGEALVNGGLISEAMQQKRLIENYSQEDDLFYYGLGMKRIGTFFGHTGGLHGYQTNVFVSREKNATIVVLFNCTLQPFNPLELTRKFLNILYGADY